MKSEHAAGNADLLTLLRAMKEGANQADKLNKKIKKIDRIIAEMRAIAKEEKSSLENKTGEVWDYPSERCARQLLGKLTQIDEVSTTCIGPKTRETFADVLTVDSHYCSDPDSVNRRIEESLNLFSQEFNKFQEVCNQAMEKDAQKIGDRDKIKIITFARVIQEILSAQAEKMLEKLKKSMDGFVIDEFHKNKVINNFQTISLEAFEKAKVEMDKNFRDAKKRDLNDPEIPTIAKPVLMAVNFNPLKRISEHDIKKYYYYRDMAASLLQGIDSLRGFKVTKTLWGNDQEVEISRNLSLFNTLVDCYARLTDPPEYITKHQGAGTKLKDAIGIDSKGTKERIRIVQEFKDAGISEYLSQQINEIQPLKRSQEIIKEYVSYLLAKLPEATLRQYEIKSEPSDIHEVRVKLKNKDKEPILVDVNFSEMKAGDFDKRYNHTKLQTLLDTLALIKLNEPGELVRVVKSPEFKSQILEHGSTVFGASKAKDFYGKLLEEVNQVERGLTQDQRVAYNQTSSL